MDKKQRLAELNEQDARLVEEAEKLRNRIILDDNYEEYDGCANDEERKEKYPELFMLELEMDKLGEKIDAILNEIDVLEQEIQKEEEINARKQHFKEAGQRIKDAEVEIEAMQVEHARLNEECKGIFREIATLKNTQEYKDGDKETLAKIKELDDELTKKAAKRTSMADTIRQKRKETDELNQELEAYINEGKQRYKEVEQKIKDAEAEIEAKQEEHTRLNDECKGIFKEIAALKNTQEYKDGDKETLAKIKKLDDELTKKAAKRTSISNEIKEKRKDINELEKEKEELVKQYGEDIIPVEQQPERASEERRQEVEDEDREEEEEPKKKNNNNRRQNQRNNNNNSRNNNVVRASASPVSQNAPEVQEPEEEAEETAKEKFNKLYAKAKSGELGKEDFDELAKIMQDPSKYDELGITTGRIFNKSKVILKAMANVASKNGKAIKLCEEKFGITFEKASKNNGYLGASSLRDWKSLKNMVDNPGQKIASEEMFKKIVEMDRDSLNDEQKAVWDTAKERLDRFGALRSSLQAYGNVTKERSQSRTSWFSKFRKETPKALSESPESPKAGPSLGDTLSRKVNIEVQDPPRRQTPPSVSREDR